MSVKPLLPGDQRRLHGMTPVPDGKTVADLLPSFSSVKNEIHLGTPNPECASCRKPFTALRKRRAALRLYPNWLPLPFAFSFDICGHCLALHQKGGADRDAVLAAVEAYCDGGEAGQ